jgi:hypothetical protein
MNNAINNDDGIFGSHETEVCFSSCGNHVVIADMDSPQIASDMADSLSRLRHRFLKCESNVEARRFFNDFYSFMDRYEK